MILTNFTQRNNSLFWPFIPMQDQQGDIVFQKDPWVLRYHAEGTWEIWTPNFKPYCAWIVALLCCPGTNPQEGEQVCQYWNKWFQIFEVGSKNASLLILLQRGITNSM